MKIGFQIASVYDFEPVHSKYSAIICINENEVFSNWTLDDKTYDIGLLITNNSKINWSQI